MADSSNYQIKQKKIPRGSNEKGFASISTFLDLSIFPECCKTPILSTVSRVACWKQNLVATLVATSHCRDDKIHVFHNYLMLVGCIGCHKVEQQFSFHAAKLSGCGNIVSVVVTLHGSLRKSGKVRIGSLCGSHDFGGSFGSHGDAIVMGGCF